MSFFLCSFQRMQAEGVVALGVEPGQGVGEEGLLLGVGKVGMENDVHEGLQALVGELLRVHQIAHRVRLLKHGIQL